METVEINSDSALMQSSGTAYKAEGTYDSETVTILSKENSFDVFDMDEEEE